MPLPENIQAALHDKIESIALATQEMDPSFQDKPSLVGIISQVEEIKAALAPHQEAALSVCTDWWDKALTAALLDQFGEASEGLALLRDIAEWMKSTLSASPTPPLHDLITHAAALLEIPIPEETKQLWETPSENGAVTEDNLETLENAIISIYQDEQLPAQTGASPETGPPSGQNNDHPAEAGPSSQDLEPEILDFTDTLFDESLIYDFIDEAETHLEAIEPEILNLESHPENMSLVDEIFRPVHSIKGSAGFLGVKALVGFAHEVENLLDAARKGTIPVSRDMTQTFLEAIDVIKTMLSQLRVVSDRHFSGDGAGEPLPPVPVQRVLAQVRAHLNGDVLPPSTVAQTDEDLKIGEILLSEGEISRDDLQKALSLQSRGLGEILVQEGGVPPDKIEAALEKQQSVSSRPRGSIRVDIEKLDNLMNLVGELVISQTQVADQIQNNNHTKNGEDFGKNIGQLGKITKEMQDQVMSLRMVPLRPILQKMTRVVRDVSQKSGKSVRLIFSGEDTEVDKTVSEMLNDPLVHIFRNSVDHGIESPSEREAAGKEPEGVIRLSAKHEGGNIVIEISDDGKGLNKDRILQKAAEKGLITPDTQLNDSQIHQLIMTPGFSTVEKITDISGRGVGLDVVRRNIEELRGSIEIQSTEGKGSCFTIRLPLTLAIIDGMVILSGGKKFILPTLSIIRTLQPKAEEIKTIQGKGEMITSMDSLLPLIRMDWLYALRDVPIAPTKGLAVVVENHKGENYALLVDELLGQQQVVVKNLGPLIPDNMGIAGGTILADGHVGLILDMSSIPDAFKKIRRAQPPKTNKEEDTIAAGTETHEDLTPLPSSTG